MTRGLTLAALVLLSTAALGADLQAGRDYLAIVPPQPTSDPKRIVVSEFFSYECPHCYSFFPAVTAWAKKLPDDVVFERVPISLGHSVWEKPVQLFYALKAMGKLDQLDGAIFRAIHVDHVDLTTESGVVDWVAKQGVSREDFEAALKSFSVQSFAKRSDAMSRTYKIPATPSMVVDGKYIVPISDNGDFAGQLEHVDTLIAKVRAAKKTP
jgi:protein dithiol oxidoreductase (disulfide-forming)